MDDSPGTSPDADTATLTARLFAELYSELHSYARGRLRPNGSCQPTMLVNEAFVRIVASHAQVADRRELFCLAATTMRHILVDHARRRSTQTRRLGGKVPLDDVVEQIEAQSTSLVDIDAALQRVAAIAPVYARILELRLCCGSTIQECSKILGCSIRAAYRTYETARALLKVHLPHGQ